MTEAVLVLRQAANSIDAKVPRDAMSLLAAVDALAKGPAQGGWASKPATALRLVAEEAIAEAQQVRASLQDLQGALHGRGIALRGEVEELRDLLTGRGIDELLPGARVTSEVVEWLETQTKDGWGDWTAERFARASAEVSEVLAAARGACDALGAFFARLGVPAETSQTGLQAIEVLVAAAEAAPRDVLALRGPGLARPDFADTAIRAEEALKALSHRGTRIAEAFDVEALPDDDALREHVRVFRRGDGLFNFLRGDWRRAKAAFDGSSRKQAKYSAAAMADRFSAILSWRKSVSEFCSNEQFRSSFGPLFAGTSTDLRKVRRLHQWLRTSSESLLATDLGAHVNLVFIPEGHLNLLASNAERVRGWLSQIERLTALAGTLHGFQAVRVSSLKAEELFGPIEQHARAMEEKGAKLRSTVRPAVAVDRALVALALHQSVAEHADRIRALLDAPARLAQVGSAVGWTPEPSHSLNPGLAAHALIEAAGPLRQLCDRIPDGLGADVSPSACARILRAVSELQGRAEVILSDRDVPIQGPLAGLIDARNRQAQSALDLAAELATCVKPSRTVHQALAGLQADLDAQMFLESLKSDRALVQRFGGHLQGLETDEGAVRSCLNWGNAVAAIAPLLPPAAANRLLRRDAAHLTPRLLAHLQAAAAASGELERSLDELRRWGTLDRETWLEGPFPADIARRLHQAQEVVSTVVPWSKYLAAKEEAHELDLGDLIKLAEEGRVAADALSQSFEYVLFRSLSRDILTTHRDLARFTGAGHESLRAEFAKLDREVIALNGQVHAHRIDSAKRPQPGVSSGRAGDLTEMSLLHREIAKTRKHIPIRQLLKRAGRSLLELKPCFMMGPLSVAQYLEQGYLSFDLIVMDEASQLRPEDALGAVARGQQLVVVGDPKQLPPTNFFDRLMESDDEDADDAPAVVDGVESILGVAEHLFRPVRTLRWHYRSKHQSLIAFSNSRFYENRLVVFPSPYKRSKRLGVNYRYVAEGQYQDRRNVPEAQRVVDAVIEHMRAYPEESLGVVTLNQTQRELVEDLFDKKSRDVPGLAEYLDRHEKSGWTFFIKNLENVQGDERDVIFVSTTFGKPPGSASVRQTFGPINRPDGWRRLNVLFTRARRRIDLFTSMLPSDVHVDERASLGRRALREYLEFARTGLLPEAQPTQTGKEPDSHFEVAVANALRQHNYEVEHQVGVAGYFIDLGVKHPERRGEYLAGIECDGATYHSSRSARDRDRIRQEILESLNWKGRIFRVWSTDWFSDPRRQIARLVTYLQGREQEDVQRPPEDVVDDDDLPDDVAPNASEPVRERLDLASTAANGLASSARAEEVFVDVGDRVTYEVVGESVEPIAVQIVDSTSNLKLGLVNHLAPLAQALLGLCEGDEGHLKVKDNPPRRLRVLKIERLQVVH